MELSTKIAMLEYCLHRLQTRDQNNAGVCRRIQRELRAWRAAAGLQTDCAPADPPPEGSGP